MRDYRKQKVLLTKLKVRKEVVVARNLKRTRIVTKELSAISVNQTVNEGSKSDIATNSAKIRENCKFPGTRV